MTDIDNDSSDVEMDQEEKEIKMIAMSSQGGPATQGSRVMMSESVARSMELEENGDEEYQQQPQFPKLSAIQANGNRSEYRRVRCPPHRYTPLREHWEQILTPLVEYLKLQVCCLE